MLNEFQRRRVSLTLLGLEEDLHDIEEHLKRGDYRGILYGITNDIPSPTRDAMISKMTLIKEKISELSERFSLRGETEMLSREIFGKMSGIWVSLEETKAGRLRGYGGVAEELHDLLDPALDEIIVLVEEIRQALSNT